MSTGTSRGTAARGTRARARAKRASDDGPFFTMRAPRHLRERMILAAREDGINVADELARLLDLRDQWAALTAAEHPLGTPAVIPALEHHPCCVAARKAAAPRDHRRDGIDYWYGRGYWTPPEKQDQAAS